MKYNKRIQNFSLIGAMQQVTVFHQTKDPSLQTVNTSTIWLWSNLLDNVQIQAHFPEYFSEKCKNKNQRK